MSADPVNVRGQRTSHRGRRAGRPSRGRRGDPDGGREASPTCRSEVACSRSFGAGDAFVKGTPDHPVGTAPDQPPRRPSCRAYRRVRARLSRALLVVAWLTVAVTTRRPVGQTVYLCIAALGVNVRICRRPGEIVKPRSSAATAIKCWFLLPMRNRQAALTRGHGVAPTLLAPKPPVIVAYSHSSISLATDEVGRLRYGPISPGCNPSCRPSASRLVAQARHVVRCLRKAASSRPPPVRKEIALSQAVTAAGRTKYSSFAAAVGPTRRVLPVLLTAARRTYKSP